MPAPEPLPVYWMVTSGFSASKASFREPITSSMEVEPLVLTVPLTVVVAVSPLVSSVVLLVLLVVPLAVLLVAVLLPPQATRVASSMTAASVIARTFFIA